MICKIRDISWAEKESLHTGNAKRNFVILNAPSVGQRGWDTPHLVLAKPCCVRTLLQQLKQFPGSVGVHLQLENCSSLGMQQWQHQCTRCTNIWRKHIPLKCTCRDLLHQGHTYAQCVKELDTHICLCRENQIFFQHRYWTQAPQQAHEMLLNALI